MVEAVCRNRQLDDEHAADAPGPGFVPELSAVRRHDPERDGQAQAGALSGLFGGKERIEKTGSNWLGNARPVVDDRDTLKRKSVKRRSAFF